MLVFLHVVVLEQPSNVTMCVGGNATFTCIVSRRDEDITSVGWMILNSDGVFTFVEDRSRHILTRHRSSNDDRLTENLTIINLTTSDNGTLYRCNPAGHIFSNNVSLTVAGICITLSVYISTETRDE